MKDKNREWQDMEDERGFNSPLSDPPEEFIDWWAGHDHCSHPCKSPHGRTGYSSGITAFKAWQIRCYKREFEERRLEHASGTGVNYSYYGWWKPEPKPKTSNPKFLAEHKEWCRRNGKPVPEDRMMPKLIAEASSFADAKDFLDVLSEQMDMNKAIGWTKADSDAINEPPPPVSS